MNFIPFPILETDRLMLRKTSKKDAKEILFLRSDPTINQFIKRDTPKNLKDAEDFLDNIATKIENTKSIYWGITLKGNPQVIGSICLWNFSADLKTGEVGYDLNPAFQQQGIMSEALNMVLNYGFYTLDFDNIEAYTQYQNEGSQRLLRKHHFELIEHRKDEDNPDNLIFNLKKEKF